MKYIDADRLKAEIERKIHEISHPLKDGYEVQSIGKIEGLSELLEIIDSLQQEQPEVDLDEEMVSYIEQHFHIRNDETLEVGNDPLTTYDFENIARHFFNLGLNARKEEK